MKIQAGLCACVAVVGCVLVSCKRADPEKEALRGRVQELEREVAAARVEMSLRDQELAELRRLQSAPPAHR